MLVIAVGCFCVGLRNLASAEIKKKLCLSFFVLFTVASMLSVLVIECVAFIIISVGCACFGVFMGVFMHLRHRSRLALTGLRLFCAPC